ncbi:hypothetical protein Ocin01_17426 [Orchesella cincta]|uniref:Uncharacterized protein n=1 Tax=Orchesella cincta TaxID=48709 RepID=A0A1D2M8E2_ORCCI|nr:hypothetical protein Ocin01_17426 [Orchesella cincta]
MIHTISFSSPPDDPRQCPLNFVPTTSADERKSESKEVPESSTKSLIGTLKTPELTPPTVPRPTNRNMEKKSPASSKNISLHTPELSPSLRKIVAMKKAHMSKQASHHNLDTDCSEMSDFIASEVEKYEKKGSPSEQPNKSYQEESLKLVTPQLSKSPVANTKIPSRTTKPARKRVDIEIPELDASTLSGVSTFQDSNHSAPEIQPSLRENEGRIESPKEKVQIPPESPVKDSNDDLQQLETPKEAEFVKSSNENSSHQNTYSAFTSLSPCRFKMRKRNMNVSGETVIDLLSEGEFIGAAYRSPGELSFRQPYRLPRSTITSSEHSPATKPSLEESKDGGESDLSFISSGLQIIGGPERHANFSLGEYLQR